MILNKNEMNELRLAQSAIVDPGLSGREPRHTGGPSLILNPHAEELSAIGDY